MAIYIVCCIPVAQYPVGKRIEARYAEVADEILVIIIRDEGEMTGIAGYHYTIQNGKRQKNAQGEPSFFFQVLRGIISLSFSFGVSEILLFLQEESY